MIILAPLLTLGVIYLLFLLHHLLKLSLAFRGKCIVLFIWYYYDRSLCSYLFESIYTLCFENNWSKKKSGLFCLTNLIPVANIEWLREHAHEIIKAVCNSCTCDDSSFLNFGDDESSLPSQVIFKVKLVFILGCKVNKNDCSNFLKQACA